MQKIKEEAGLRRPTKPLVRSFWPLLLAAAAILVAVVGIYVYTVNNRAHEEPPLARRSVPGPVRPGHDQAVLTLAGGRTIILDSTSTGTLAIEGGVQVAKGAGGALVYNGEGTPAQYHTVSIPRGGQYKLVLSDGTKVWLNAESALRFPAGFGAGARYVELQGEGYFEVAKDRARPFRVKSRTLSGEEQVVEVLGTVFNINAYEPPLKTTLVEGAVRVEKGGQKVVLRPGEQARGDKDLQVVRADLGKEVAWKEGLFVFRDASIQEIGQQITRWYDVTVEYKGTIPYHFNATIERKEPLSTLLDVLQTTRRVRFTLQGKKLIIEP